MKVEGLMDTNKTHNDPAATPSEREPEEKHEQHDPDPAEQKLRNANVRHRATHDTAPPVERSPEAPYGSLGL